MEQLRSVIVFGDSLSDIGTKWTTSMGAFAKFAGLMTVNPSGRFSDCRNWTDFMFEEASGGSLITGAPHTTIEGSRNHLKLSAESECRGDSPTSFFYANYAEGGACGKYNGIGLGLFDDQVWKFARDLRQLGAGRPKAPVLFLIWFGANDLYTAGCKPTAMADVAKEIAGRQRGRLANVVGAGNARFIFMNLARPEASVRYQERAKEAGSWTDNVKKAFGGGVEHELQQLGAGVDLFNMTLRQQVGSNGDGLVDVASRVSPYQVGAFIGSSMKDAVNSHKTLVAGAQKKGSSNLFVPAQVYDNPKLAKLLMGPTNVTTSDQAHPTDRMYKLIWESIKKEILAKGYTFGNLGAGARALARA